MVEKKNKKANVTAVYALYYSATGNTAKVVKAVTEKIAQELGLPAKYMTYTSPASREKDYEFGEGDLVIVGTPVYAGRVPNKMLPFLQTRLHGKGALALPVVTFGNRAYDNSLRELGRELIGRGFCVVGGAAVVAQHAFANKLGANRPTEEDLCGLRAFAKQVADKLETEERELLQSKEVPGEEEVGAYYTPLGIDGKPTVFLKAKPKTHMDKCTVCNVCVKCCPMGAITLNKPDEVPGVCIKCQACVKKCPTGAKYFDDPAFLSHLAMLEEHYIQAKENAFFLS
ncbi:MAG: EFR1 family ferrodoxin [Roseburia sp.]